MLVRWIVLFVAILAVSSCGGDKGAEAQTDISAFLANSDSFREKSQYQSALIEARNATQAAPKDERGYISVAKTMIELGQAREAVRVLSEIEGSSEDYLVTLAEGYFGSGKARSASVTR